MTASDTRFRFDDKMNFDFHAPSHAHVQLDNSLLEIEQAELIRGLAEEEYAYTFRHVLVQDTAHSTLLKQERRRLHEQAAESLIASFPENVEFSENIGRAGLALASFYAGRSEAAADLEQAHACTAELEDNWGGAVFAQALGAIYTARGDTMQAEAMLNKALDYFRPNQIAPHQGHHPCGGLLYRLCRDGR